jgi:hypothetical protein
LIGRLIERENERERERGEGEQLTWSEKTTITANAASRWMAVDRIERSYQVGPKLAKKSTFEGHRNKQCTRK